MKGRRTKSVQEGTRGRGGPDDVGKHTVCVIVTDEFLRHQASIGNDLLTPHPEFGLRGVKAGEGWCVCVDKWKESYDAGIIGPVCLDATHEDALEDVTLEMLLDCATVKSSHVN